MLMATRHSHVCVTGVPVTGDGTLVLISLPGRAAYLPPLHQHAGHACLLAE